MKNKQIIIILSIITISITGCLVAPASAAEEGVFSYQISIGSSSRFSTISPELNISQYRIVFNSFNDNETDKADELISDSTGTLLLTVGSWEIVLSAEDSNDRVIAQSETILIDIIKNNKDTTEIILNPLSGYGTLNICLDISDKPAEITINSVEYSLEKGVSSPVEIISATELSEPYQLLIDDLEAGADYRFNFIIDTSSGVVIKEGAVHIYAELVTEGIVQLNGADFGDTDISIQPPVDIERLVFIHHSCGNHWLHVDTGNLGNVLGQNNYYVRDIYYGWDYSPNDDNIGDYTNTADWPQWFNDTTVDYNGLAKRDNVMTAVYTTDNQNAGYTPISDPGGENDIIMFKSCYPMSEVNYDDGKNYFYGIDDEKDIYNEILTYFATRQDKLFILVTPPGEENVSSWENTRELCQWLVDEEAGWLADYPYNNVGVFDFYCVLSETDSHHTIEDNQIVYEYTAEYDGISPYHDGDDHPDTAGNVKATAEFIPLLNYYYNRWKEN